MMIRFTFLFLSIFYLSVEDSFAQKDSTIYYLKNSGKPVSTRDSAELYAVIHPASGNTDSKLSIVDGYFLNGKKMYSTASLTNSFPIKPQGPFIYYFPNGNKHSVRNFENGQPAGDAFEYYPNGNFYNRRSYIKLSSDKIEVKLLDCKDSTGKALAENGNGYWIIYNNNFTAPKEQGWVANGFRDSVWTMIIDNKEIKAVYKDGKIAPRFNRAGGQIFTSVEITPEFPGGPEGFSRFLSNNIVYPNAAKANSIRGRVIITFVVEKDGSLSDITVARGIGGGCDEEALRVMKICPRWKPGIQNGNPVRVQYAVPINFTLN